MVSFFLNFILKRDSERHAINERVLARYESRRDVIDSLINSGDNNCLWELRMCRNTFAHLCEILRVRGGLVQIGRVTIEEQVIIFLNVLAHHTKNRSIQVRFSRSGQIISRYCYRVLAAVYGCKMNYLSNHSQFKTVAMKANGSGSRYTLFEHQQK